MVRHIIALPESVIASIRQFIAEKNLQFDYLLRDNIFELLERYCTVLYYPQENEENDGCHVKRLINDKVENFVFINTNKSVEKQVFTAAHELAHILELDVYLKQHCSDYKETMEELVMNKFAALLLIPDDLFNREVQRNIKEFCYDDEKITLDNLIRFSLRLMDFFFVPFKSVVIRLYEVGHLSAEDAERVITDEDTLKKINDYIKLLGYKRLGIRSNKKSINGFAELLGKAEKAEVFPKTKIDSIREKMGFPNINTESLSDTIKFAEQKSE